VIATEIVTPRKAREITISPFDSTVWNDVVFRPDDIVIATYAKSGTTWTQQIVSQLLFDGAEDIDLHSASPWLDMCIPEREVRLAAIESQTHRRFIKTHLPLDALVFSPMAKYLYVCRDGRDVVWSLHNHHASGNNRLLRWLADSERSKEPIPDIKDYFVRWLDRDGYPTLPFWQHIRSWWEIRHLPNVLLVHYANLKSDLPGQIRRIADFLGIAIDEKKWPAIVDHCSFSYMKAHAAQYAPRGGIQFKRGADDFIHKGTNGRWNDVLTDDECRRYEETARHELGSACAHWLATGKIAAE
jgi:aryl sulfotransferase